ncbi:hypothetical protein [Fusobacterium nucleatum]|nr:hypothetical protein [Fusobacterium nucleatum]
MEVKNDSGDIIKIQSELVKQMQKSEREYLYFGYVLKFKEY